MVKVAMIGVGAISGIYLKNITNVFKEVELVGVCDLIPERAEKGVQTVKEYIEAGAKAPVPKIYKDMYEAFNDPEVEVVLNLTRPYEHYGVTKAALEHGKHVFSEKPLAADMEEGDELVALAEEKGLLMGGAPDTFMGAGIQTVRKLVDDGYIGDIVAANCAMICHGHETWHPDPEFYYKRAGGPMMDMGPYYVTALVQLIGEAKGVIGMTKSLAKELAGRNITVNAVAPGFIETDMTAAMPQAAKDAMMPTIPMQRLGAPEDVAKAVAFLASLLRNIFGLGSLLAFPGSMCGALLCGLVYWKTRNLPATLAGEVFGTGIIGGLLSYPVAVAFMGVVAGSIAFYAYVVPFLVSTVGGSILAGILVFTLQKSGALKSMRAALEH